MFDINILDKNLTYIGGECGKTPTALAIQIRSKLLLCDLLKSININLQPKDIFSHVYALIYTDNNWYIYESHLKWGGVKKLLYSDWKKLQELENNFVFSYPLSISTLEMYAKFNPGYSLGEIGELALSKHTNKIKDKAGIICSGLIAHAIPDHKPCFEFTVAPWCTIPLHIQLLDPKYERSELCQQLSAA